MHISRLLYLKDWKVEASQHTYMYASMTLDSLLRNVMNIETHFIKFKTKFYYYLLQNIHIVHIQAVMFANSAPHMKSVY